MGFKVNQTHKLKYRMMIDREMIDRAKQKIDKQELEGSFCNGWENKRWREEGRQEGKMM